MNPLSAVQVYVALALLALSALGGSFVTDKVWEAKWNAHMASDRRAEADAQKSARHVETAQSGAVEARSTKAAVKDQAVQATTRDIVKEIPKHVTPAQDARGCVTYGLVRVLDAAALGVNPADLALPAGKSDDACTPIAPSDLGRSVAENYGTARQNAVQLDELIGFGEDQKSILNGTEKELPQ